MDWGKGILVTIIVFVSFILVLVTISVRQDDIHLVTENYYEEEMKYQEHIQREQATAELGRDVLVLDAQGKVMQLDLPIGAKGSLHFFRPSDAGLDLKIPIHITEAGGGEIPLGDLLPGYWRVKLTWTENGVNYYQEKKIEL
jgi:hypothetical protein